MLSRLQYLVEGFFESSAVLFRNAGLSPNLTTLVGFGLTVAAGLLYYGGLSSTSTWLVAWVLLLAASYFDAVDGAMARRFKLVSRTGGVLDSVLDRIGEMIF